MKIETIIYLAVRIIIILGSFCAGYLISESRITNLELESFNTAQKMEDFLLRQEQERKRDKNDYFLKTLDSLNNEKTN